MSWVSATALDTFDRQSSADTAKLCGSCGKNPPHEGYEMCAACRIAVDLPVSDEARREVEHATTAATRKTNRPKEVTVSTGKKMGRPPKLVWTPAMDEVLRDSTSAMEAAEALGVSQSAIYRRVNQLGIKFGKREAAEYEPSGTVPAPTEGVGVVPPQEDIATPEEVAGEPTCELCDANYATKQPNGVWLCKLCAQEALAAPLTSLFGHPCDGEDEHRLLSERNERYTAQFADGLSLPVEDATLRDIVEHGGTVRIVPSDELAIIDILAERIDSLESYRELSVWQRIRLAVANQHFPYDRHGDTQVAIIEWAQGRLLRRNQADARRTIETAARDAIADIRRIEAEHLAKLEEAS